MDFSFLLKGLLLGFSIAAPVGQIGILCIRRTLAEGRASGFVSGLGAATADALYGAVAAFGLAFISDFLLRQQTPLRLLGGAFLCYLGVRTFLTRPSEKPVQLSGRGLLGAYASTFALTLANPSTILSFAVMFAALGTVGTQGHYLPAGLLVLGVFLGSALWWFILSGGVSILRSRMNVQSMMWVNRASGVIIAALGLLVIGSLLVSSG